MSAAMLGSDYVFDDDDAWACPACTFVNDCGSVCAMCGTRQQAVFGGAGEGGAQAGAASSAACSAGTGAGGATRDNDAILIGSSDESESGDGDADAGSGSNDAAGSAIPSGKRQRTAAAAPAPTREPPSNVFVSAAAFSGGGSSAASKSLMRALKDLRTSDESGKFKVEVGDDLYNWRLTMPSAAFIDDAPELFADLEKFAERFSRPAAVEMLLHFPKDFPFSPPFVRVVRPRFQFHTGHVTIGGSICTEFLTRGGGDGSWRPTVTVESLMLFIHSTLIEGGARVDFGSHHHPRPDLDYSDAEARAAFNRVARQHGWVP